MIVRFYLGEKEIKEIVLNSSFSKIPSIKETYIICKSVYEVTEVVIKDNHFTDVKVKEFGVFE